jgi:hypothetical protein
MRAKYCNVTIGRAARDAALLFIVSRTEHTNTVRTSEEKHYFRATEPNGSVLLGETVAVSYENRTE